MDSVSEDRGNTLQNTQTWATTSAIAIYSNGKYFSDSLAERVNILLCMLSRMLCMKMVLIKDNGKMFSGKKFFPNSFKNFCLVILQQRN